ncbi:c-type cytochrome [Microvirga lotononidis]|uniref:Cytochrome c553 n=1 Tax=Microvirga lotononidis TaxID=864069 RepID=I4YY34_9HYPH|nr:cytochrome c [Microvirga lotononidis]EIM28876.1 cytochrome c553 [Microvirga lotononidis]WQO26798.1 cytochrome c [Microvirga lotononidis]
MRFLAIGAIGLLLGSTSVMAQAGRIQRGQTFAQTNCSQCHAIGKVGESPIPEAPPFRTLHTRYQIEDLAEAFAEGITTGHPSMPQFQLDPAQINDLIAYLNSIQG